jgi:hypothetical protein
MYYPKSQIKPNLYTNGGEFAYANNSQEYIGYYFKVSTGKYFSGRNQDDKPNEELLSINADITTNETALSIDSAVVVVDPIYSYVTNTPVPPPTAIPSFNPSTPTQQDYQNGEFRRLFCKKTNEIIYIEINQDTFDKLVAKDPQILWQLYQPFNITWQLTGNQEQVARINKNSVELVSFKNRFPRLDEYLKFDYTKYYNQLGTTTSGSYINGVNQGYVLDNRDRRSNGVSYSQNDSGSVRRDSSITR